MKTIICAIDYTKNAVTAIKYAHEISSKLEANLLVIHVYKLPMMLGLEFDIFYDELEKTTLKKYNSKLKKFCRKHLGKELDEMNINTDAFEALSIAQGILSKATEHKAFMIVIGMKKESALEDLFMGNTTINLIEKAPCPILAIPENATSKKLKTIVYATDFEEEDIGAIYKVSQIAKKFNAKIKVVHIDKVINGDGNIKMEWFKEMVLQKVTYKKIEFKVLFSEEIFNTLKNYLDSNHIDLVAMLEREKSGFLKKLFHRDLVKEMESFGEIPLLSFNEANY
ncbi:universal stress protein [Lutibacter sp.]|uniref:universal stress protein n=1 Tax=Lutibacter sp. TaxID=1925666 RepID=UPI003563EFF9